MISFSCGCGKQLKVKDESAGKRLRCPGCGEVVAIPTGGPVLPAVKTVRPEEKSATKSPPQEPMLPKAKKKKSKKSSSRSDERSFPIGLVVKSVLILAVIGGLVGLAVYLRVDNWFRATPPYQIAELKRVDAFIALHGFGSNVMSLVPGRSEGAKTLGGSNRLVLIRDNPAGDHYLVRLKLHQKFLSDKGAIRQSTVIVGGQNVILHGDGEKKEALFLIGEQTGEYAQKITVGLSKIKLPGQRRDPLAALGKNWNTEGIVKPPKQDDPLDTREPPPATGNMTYRSPGGMQVDGVINPDSIQIQWDPATTGYSASGQIEETEQLFDSYKFDVLCIFPVPKGETKLRVFDGPELPVNP